MKKLLSLLSILTISGTAVQTTIAASPYAKQEKLISNINLKTNSLETLNRIKRSKVVMSKEKFLSNPKNKNKRIVDKIENDYCFLCSNYLILQIDNIDLEDIYYFKDTHNNDRDALFNKIFRTINEFKKENHSADTQNSDYISNNDISIISNVIIDHFQEIRNVFEKNTKKGLIIRTNRNSYWNSNDGDNWWGAHPEY